MPFAEFLSGLVSLVSCNTSAAPINCGNGIPLESTFLVICEAIGVNLLYAFGRRRFTNVEKMRRYNAEMKAFRSEMSEATKSGDKQKVEKLKKKQQQMQKMQAEISMDQMKPTLMFMVPLFGVYYLVRFFVGLNTILAIGPFPIQIDNIGPPIAINFFWWYFLCSFTFSGIISRLFGLTMD
ncbi:MAG: EMC3/TMCO1 family protein [Nitrososphaerales archaeon]